MKTIGLLEFRQNAESILRRASRGERLILSYRGKPAAVLSPYVASGVAEDDSFYRITEIADDAGGLTNREMDEWVYEA